jgi:hypothetical protein
VGGEQLGEGVAEPASDVGHRDAGGDRGHVLLRDLLHLDPEEDVGGAGADVRPDRLAQLAGDLAVSLDAGLDALEMGGEDCPLVAVRQHARDLRQREVELAQPPQADPVVDLVTVVQAVPAPRVDSRRLEQADLVVVAERLDAQARAPGEAADRDQHENHAKASRVGRVKGVAPRRYAAD